MDQEARLRVEHLWSIFKSPPPLFRRPSSVCFTHTPPGTDTLAFGRGHRLVDGVDDGSRPRWPSNGHHQRSMTFA